MPHAELLEKEFDKIYVLDTNIILNQAENIELLSQEGSNLIVLPEIVLDEIDAKKTGFDEINFQARSFARLLSDAKIGKKISEGNLNFTKIDINHGSNIVIHVVTKNEYDADKANVDRKIINDRKILEVTRDVQDIYDYPEEKFIFLSIDIMARIRALSLGINTETLTLDSDEDMHTIDFSIDLEIPNFSGNVKDIPEDIEEHKGDLCIMDTVSGHPYYYFKSNNNWLAVDDKNTKRVWSTPRNREQRVLSEMIIDDSNDIIVISGPAGTGKNYVSLGAVCKLMDNNKDKYSKIVYIRKTVISGNKDDELGFLPGDLSEKMNGYTQPMESSIKKLMMNKAKKKLTKEELEEQISKFKERYEVEYVYSGHLRGDTFDEGTIIVLDESQNWDRSTMKTIISRTGENCLLLVMGSNNQIDTPYLGKANNALTFMMGQVGKENSSDVVIKGCNLTNVVRSKVSEWADIAFDRD